MTGPSAAIAGVLLGVAALGAAGPGTDDAIVLLGPLAPGSAADDPPPGWTPLAFRKVPRHTVYRVVRDGETHVLRAESDAAASALYRPIDADPRVYPVLTWRWKVENLLRRADARRKDGDDYPARVYVAFRRDPARASPWERARNGVIRLLYGRDPPEAVINYIWDTRLPVGTMLDNAYTGRARMVVLRSGPADVGRWTEERRNVVEDYRKLFGDDPPRMEGIAVMTDTDDTGERAVAYYADIVLRRARP